VSNAELERLDPESEACFDALKVKIAWELGARVAIGDDPSTPEGCNALAELIADAVLDGFVVRNRESPRYRWSKPELRVVADAVANFRVAAIEKGDGTLSPNIDHALHGRMTAALFAIEATGATGRDVLRGLLADQSPHVRCWVASHLLATGDPAAEAVLAELASAPGLLAFAAQTTLRLHRAGRLKSPFPTAG